MEADHSDKETEPNQAITEKNKYSIGQRLVYPTRGICDVIAIEERDACGCKQTFYILYVQSTQTKIMVPIKNADAVGLRPLMSEVEIRQIFEIFCAGAKCLSNENWPQRKKTLNDKVRQGSAIDLAEIITALMMLKKSRRQIAFSELKMLDNAKTLLITEIAAARKQTDIQVWTEIEAIFATL